MFVDPNKGELRPWGKTKKSLGVIHLGVIHLGVIHLPPALVEELSRWKEKCPKASAKAFIFADANGGFMDTGDYRRRVLHKLAEKLKLPKLTFQVVRRTIATLVQKKGTVKDVQALLRHSRAATTTDVYTQEIPESVQATINAIHAELTTKARAQAGG
jgi:integrase